MTVDLDLSENLEAKIIDRFYAEKDSTSVHKMFVEQMEIYEWFGSARDDGERCVWVRNLYYILCRYVDKIGDSQQYDHLRTDWAYVCGNKQWLDIIRWPSDTDLPMQIAMQAIEKTAGPLRSAHGVISAGPGAG